MILTKKCIKCKTEKEVIKFNKNGGNKTGYNGVCKECQKIDIKQKRALLFNNIIEKICTRCNLTKQISEFHINNNNLDGFKGQCKECLGIKNPVVEHLKEEGKRWCNRCKQNKDFLNFHNSKNQMGKKSYMCKECVSDIWNDKKIQLGVDGLRMRQRDLKLRREFNISLDKYSKILENQNGKCRICLSDKPGGRYESFPIDHDHSCCIIEKGSRKTCGNCIRGLICQNCNIGLGGFKDDPELLRKAALYIEKSRTKEFGIEFLLNTKVNE